MKKRVVKKPWGKFTRFSLNEKSTVKILTVLPNQEFSLQDHKKRMEFWKILDNPVKITLGKKIFRAKKGDEIMIPKKTLHRAHAYSKEVNILEIAYGRFAESDIERIKDRYGRI